MKSPVLETCRTPPLQLHDCAPPRLRSSCGTASQNPHRGQLHHRWTASASCWTLLTMSGIWLLLQWLPPPRVIKPGTNTQHPNGGHNRAPPDRPHCQLDALTTLPPRRPPRAFKHCPQRYHHAHLLDWYSHTASSTIPTSEADPS